MSDFNFEPIRGLPGVPPAGETILWQGAPDWRILACEAFHIRAAAAYFAVMLAWRVVSGLSDGQSPLAVAVGVLSVAPIALVALGTLAFLAWLNSRTTVYTITSRRVVMRFGAALSKSINIPFAIVDTAGLKALPGGAGDLALTLRAPNKIAFIMLWPHARPWKVGSPQPTLRCVPDVRAVAQTLGTAMKRDVSPAVLRGETPARDTGSTGLRPSHAPTAA
jgi:hypothetical protein